MLYSCCESCKLDSHKKFDNGLKVDVVESLRAFFDGTFVEKISLMNEAITIVDSSGVGINSPLYYIYIDSTTTRLYMLGLLSKMKGFITHQKELCPWMCKLFLANGISSEEILKRCDTPTRINTIILLYYFDGFAQQDMEISAPFLSENVIEDLKNILYAPN